MANNTEIIPMMMYNNGSLQAYQIKIVKPETDWSRFHTILFGLEETRNHYSNREISILDSDNHVVGDQSSIINQLRDNASKVNHISPSIRNRTVTFINRNNLRQYYLVEQDRMIYLGFIREDLATRSIITIDPCGADINIKEVVQRLQGTSVQKLLDIWRVAITSNQTQIIKYFIISDEINIRHQSGVATEINLQESMIRYQGEKLGHFKNWFILASYKHVITSGMTCNDLSIENKSSLEYNVYWKGDIIKSSNNKKDLLINPGIRYNKQKEYLCNPTDYATLQDQQYMSDEPKQPVQNHVRTGQWNIIRPVRTAEQDKAIFDWLKSLEIIEKRSGEELYRNWEYYGEQCYLYKITIKNTLDSHKQFIDQLLRHKVISDFNTNLGLGQWEHMQFRREEHIHSKKPDLCIDSFINLKSLQLRKDSEIIKNVEKATGDSNYLDK